MKMINDGLDVETKPEFRARIRGYIVLHLGAISKDIAEMTDDLIHLKLHPDSEDRPCFTTPIIEKRLDQRFDYIKQGIEDLGKL